jgi:hypothetical protein
MPLREERLEKTAAFFTGTLDTKLQAVIVVMLYFEGTTFEHWPEQPFKSDAS